MERRRYLIYAVIAVIIGMVVYACYMFFRDGVFTESQSEVQVNIVVPTAGGVRCTCGGTMTDYSRTATCTQSGFEGLRCSSCGREVGTTSPALGHSYGSYVVTKSATCTSSGTKTATCSRCGDEKTQTIAALGHSYSSTKYSATCTSQGYTRYRCSRCSYSYTSNYTSALGHSYGSYVQTKAPTCTEKGTETATCSRCSATTSRDIAALGHEAVTDEAVAATCTSAGLTEGSHCSRCDTVLEQQETVPTLGHNYGSYVQTKSPTCTEKGTETTTCSRCSATTSRDIAALGHSVVTDEAVAATCTTSGLTEGSHCSRCDTVLEEQETVPALGHSWSDWEDSRTSCDEVGIRTRSCSVCGEEETEELPAGTHTWDNGTVTKQPDCTQSGTIEFTCIVCGDISMEDIAPLDHTEVSVAGFPATCTENGLTDGSKCSVCGVVLTEQQLVPALGHKLIHIAAVEPTEDMDGNIEYWQCDRCGKYFSDKNGDIEIDISEVFVTYSGGRSLWQVILVAAAGVVLFVVIIVIIGRFSSRKKVAKKRRR